MIKFSVFYPADGGMTFDHDYYLTKHIAADQSAARRGLRLLYDRYGHVRPRAWYRTDLCGDVSRFSQSVEIFQAAFAPHWAEIVADVANYTDIVPLS